MEAVPKFHHRHQPLHLSLHHHRPSLSGPISSLFFRTPPSPSSLSVRPSLSIRASSFSEPLLPRPKISKPQLTEIASPFPFSFFKTTVIVAIAATAVFFARFNLKPLVASANPPPAAIETSSEEAVSNEEKNLEEHVASHPDDVTALRNLMEAKVKNRKVEEAIVIVEQLIKLEPDDIEWLLLKAHMHCYNGELETAKNGFNEILERDSFRVEAYHGLVMAASHEDSGGELKEIEKKVGKAMEMCKREKKSEELRDFKLLMAQIRVIEGNYNDALKVYQELVKEEPKDFRPYLCQGIIYTLLRKKDEAEKQFQNYRMLVPEGHPYAQYFDDNMIATKAFVQKVENGRVGFRS